MKLMEVSFVMKELVPRLIIACLIPRRIHILHQLVLRGEQLLLQIVHTFAGGHHHLHH